jgi:integrase
MAKKTFKTDLQFQQLKTPSLPIKQWDYWDTQSPLGVRITYKGTKTYFVMSRVLEEGLRKLKRISLGHVGAIPLTEARDQARNFQAMAKDGLDPRTITREKKETQVEESRLSFQATRAEFITRYCKGKDEKGKGRLRPATLAEYERILNGDELKSWEKKSIRSIDRKAILQVIDSIVDRGAPIMANRYSAVLSRYFSWCLERGYIDAAPPISKPGKETKRDRVLTDPEIIDVWNAAVQKKGIYAEMIKLLLLTGQRRGEVSGMRWEELHDLDGENPYWIIPATRSKNGIQHTVSLSPQAVQAISALPRIAKSPYCLTTTGKTPISGFNCMKERFDKLITAARAKEKLGAIPGWTLHDLRRTVASGMARLNVPPHVVEKILNHTGGEISGVAAVYNRHEYTEEKKNALNTWASYIETLLDQKKTVRVHYLNKVKSNS